MPAYKNIAVAGANGNLGPSIVQALVNGNFNVTILSQSGSSNGLPSSVHIVKVDYTSPESLTTALHGIEAVVSLIPDFGAQPALIDAAIAAGVQRFIPSEFGSNTLHEKPRSLPVFGGKLATQEYLRSKEKEISWTIIINGLFFDWGIQVGFWVNVIGGTTTIFDNGDAKHSTTLLADVGKAVAAVLAKPEDTKNRVLYIQSTAISQNKTLAIAQKKNPALKVETQKADTEEVLKGALENFGKGPAAPEFHDGIMGQLTVSIFNQKYANDWSAKNDNELLGIKELSEEEIEEVVGRYVSKEGGAEGADSTWLEKKLQK